MNYEGIKIYVRYLIEKLDVSRVNVWKCLTEYAKSEDEARALARQAMYDLDLYPEL